MQNANKLGGRDAQDTVAQAIAEQENLSSTLKICTFHDPLVMLRVEKFTERASPIVDKFYILTRDLDSVSADSLKPNKDE